MIDKAKLKASIHSGKTRKYARRALLALVVFSVLGFFILPPIVKSIMLDTLGKALHRRVTVEHISINPYAMSLTLEGVAVQEREGDETFARFDSLYLNLESASLFRGGPVLGELRLVAPKLRIVRLSETRYNFSDLMDEFMAKPKSDGPTPAFSVNNIQLSGGEVVFDDRPVDEKHVVSDINLTLPFISSMAYATETFVEPAFSAQINGAPLVIKGKSKPFAESLESEINIDLSDLQLARFLDYSPIKLPVTMLSGALDSQLKLVFHQEKEKPSTLVLSGTVGIGNVNVKESSGAPLLAFKQLDLDLAAADLLGGRFEVRRLALDSPEIHARVSRQGDINWIQFFQQKLAEGKKSATAEQKASAGNAASAEKAVFWSLAEAKIAAGAVHWSDESHGEAFKASIDKIDLDLRKLASKADKPAELDLSWRVAAGDWLKIDSFSIKGGQLDLARRDVVLGDVQAKGARSLIKRAKTGEVEWMKPPALRAVQASQEETSAPWKVSVTKYHGEDIGVRFEDNAVSPMAVHTVENLGFDLENLSTVPEQPIKLATRFKFNRKGEIGVTGSINPVPLNADLKLDIKAIELLPLQPYFAEKLNIAVTRGQVTVNGDLHVRQEKSEKADEAPALAGGFSGQATIGDFYAVDKLNSADFLRWKSFYFGKVDAKLKPDSLSIGEIALSDFFARVIVSPEGKLNLMQIVRKPENEAVAVVPPTEVAAPTAQQAESVVPAANAMTGTDKLAVPVATDRAPLMPIKIGKITLQGGTVRFTDNFVKPNYTANLRKVGGSVTGLSTEAGSIASMELRGSYDDVAPLTLSAKINPLSAKPYLDLQSEIKGIELTSFSTYSGKYAGYAIDKGKLSLFVKYKIENDQLSAENRIFLDQLTFGDAVESPDATKLPVKLAIALLKNRNGEIDINLPISGSLNDPQFSIGGLVVKVIVNLLVKAVTSPFALIGSMFGDSEELSFVEFDSGRASINAEAQKRLENLAKALVDRPALKLEIEGHIDGERDREGLKSARIDRKVRAVKREDLTKSGVESGSAGTVDVSDEEYPALLERVYRAEKFPKPRNMVGMVKSLPVEEMEKLILANSTVDDDDLLDLGNRRAKSIRDWLVDHEISVERIFLLPSKLGSTAAKPGADEKAKASRADFSLK